MTAASQTRCACLSFESPRSLKQSNSVLAIDKSPQCAAEHARSCKGMPVLMLLVQSHTARRRPHTPPYPVSAPSCLRGPSQSTPQLCEPRRPCPNNLTPALSTAPARLQLTSPGCADLAGLRRPPAPADWLAALGSHRVTLPVRRLPPSEQDKTACGFPSHHQNKPSSWQAT